MLNLFTSFFSNLTKNRIRTRKRKHTKHKHFRKYTKSKYMNFRHKKSRRMRGG